VFWVLLGVCFGGGFYITNPSYSGQQHENLKAVYSKIRQIIGITESPLAGKIVAKIPVHIFQRHCPFRCPQMIPVKYRKTVEFNSGVLWSWDMSHHLRSLLEKFPNFSSFLSSWRRGDYLSSFRMVKTLVAIGISVADPGL
jgi:hypothetical protein